jgi:dihydroorotate dehydrogenase (NAD+) catalytic subunit
MVDLTVKIGDLTLQNPVQPASGAFSWEYNDVIDLNRLGALVAKTICREPRLGNPTPRMAETEAGIIQSIGLPGKGIEYFIEHIVPEYAKFKPPLVVSVNSETIEDFAALAEELSVPDVDVIEANISCPTRNQTGGNFAMHEDYTRDCIQAIRAKTTKPLWVKLSPNAGDIVSIAKAAEAAGADALVIANTFLSLKIRTDNFRPALGNKFGGLVSPALKPIVLRMVYQVAKAVKIPIIGIGGVTKAEDVVEYMLAGASAVGIGYAGFRNPTALVQIIDDLEAWCDERGIKKVTELIGAVRDDDMETDTLVAASAGASARARQRAIGACRRFLRRQDHHNVDLRSARRQLRSLSAPARTPLRHIPGNPGMVIVNQTGAGGLVSSTIMLIASVIEFGV